MNTWQYYGTCTPLLGVFIKKLNLVPSLQAFAKFCAFPSYTSSFTHSISNHLLSIHYMLVLY